VASVRVLGPWRHDEGVRRFRCRGNHACLTLRISCEAVPPSVLPAGAQGGTSACHTGAALSFVSCIRLFDSLIRTLGLAHLVS